jgi:hypothetical protein
MNHIKYTSQRTGCELTTVYSSGQFNWWRGEPEYREKPPTCHKSLFTVSRIIYLITVSIRTHNFIVGRHQLHSYRSYIRSHFHNYMGNGDLQAYVQPRPVLSQLDQLSPALNLVHITTHCRFHRKQQLSPASHKAGPKYNKLSSCIDEFS